VYDAAGRIWTMSDALARSFRDDFRQPAEKLETMYAGANNLPEPKRASSPAPRVLFVGKDHERKGSAVLLAAFDHVRQAIPNAELHLVGGVPANANRPGVTAHGVLSRANPEGRNKLDELWGTASVFCLPSRYEPFGIVFVEAMLSGLACVGTTGWAMPEIIEEGKTGWLVPDGSVDELARVLIAALRDPVTCSRMGVLGREHALARFTWERVVAHALADIHSLGGAGRSATPARA
jgi:glycosyltransferase involved in cell wall biosynthesis